jgi:hypothetical protein
MLGRRRSGAERLSQRDLMGNAPRSQLLIVATRRESFTPTVNHESQRCCNSPTCGE